MEWEKRSIAAHFIERNINKILLFKWHCFLRDFILNKSYEKCDRDCSIANQWRRNCARRHRVSSTTHKQEKNFKMNSIPLRNWFEHLSWCNFNYVLVHSCIVRTMCMCVCVCRPTAVASSPSCTNRLSVERAVRIADDVYFRLSVAAVAAVRV